MVWDLLLVSTFLLSARVQLRFYRQTRLIESENKRAVTLAPLHRLNAIVSVLAAVVFASKMVFGFFGQR